MSVVSRLSRWVVTAILLNGVLLALPAANAQKIHRLVVFGDSLSDNGNLFALTGFPPAPFYYLGRFSNGPVWVEDLAQSLGVPLEDYAFAGANTDATDIDGPFPGINAQIGDATTGYIKTHPVADPRALYVIWGGANDYLFGGQVNPSVPVANLIDEIRRLADTGARHFLIPNLPDLGSLPATAGTVNSVPLNLLTAGHNSLLARSLDHLEDEFCDDDIDITLFDVHLLVKHVQSNPSDYGLTNVTQGYLFAPNGFPDQYLFWDMIHPSETGHQILARAAASAIRHRDRRED